MLSKDFLIIQIMSFYFNVFPKSCYIYVWTMTNKSFDLFSGRRRPDARRRETARATPQIIDCSELLDNIV